MPNFIGLGRVVLSYPGEEVLRNSWMGEKILRLFQFSPSTTWIFCKAHREVPGHAEGLRTADPLHCSQVLDEYIVSCLTCDSIGQWSSKWGAASPRDGMCRMIHWGAGETPKSCLKIVMVPEYISCKMSVKFGMCPSCLLLEL